MRLHRVPESIVSDCDTKFTSMFWHELHKLMGTKLLMSMVFHPHTDGATEQANHSIGQVLRIIIQDDQKDWATKCPMVEFALNSNVSAMTGFTPFELNQGYLPQIGLPMSFNTKLKGIKQFILQAKWDLMAAHDTIIANHVMQMFHANKKCCTSDEYNVRDHMYLSTKNLTLPKGRARKLVPKYIGPYKIVKAHSTVILKLPLVLVAQLISPTLHMGLIQRFVANNDDLFPKQDMKSFYDFSQDDEQEWLVKEIISHRWLNLKEPELEVRWMLGDTTWEPLALCKDLKVLDVYLELWGIVQPCDLLKHI